MRLTLMLISALCGFVINISAQERREEKDQLLSPYLKIQKRDYGSIIEDRFVIVTNDIERLQNFFLQHKLQKNILHSYPATRVVQLTMRWRIVDSLLIPSGLVDFIDAVRIPFEETAINGFDNSVNTINLVHDRLPSINGNGLVFSVKEDALDSTDIDFKGRYIASGISSQNQSSHASIMATIIGGAGNTYYTAKGAAWNAGISSSDFKTLLPDNDEDYSRLNISVQNHSYGTGIENYYGADAASYDASTQKFQSLVHVFSAGNSGEQISRDGKYSGIPGFANLSGSFKMAKNIITVAAIDSFYNSSSRSSKGPSYDGRIKPELVAFGQDGSSGASAIVSGIALLLQNANREAHDSLPPSSLVKAILLNTADDISNKGIDYTTGFGNVNAFRALQAMKNNTFFTGVSRPGSIESFVINVPDNVKQVKVLLCWNDIPAVANAISALVNDLDLTVKEIISGDTWQPWVLNHYPHEDSLKQFAVRKKDTINNVEQVTIDLPASGQYQINIANRRLLSEYQRFSVSYHIDTLNAFSWTYPTASDKLIAGSQIVFRWNNTFGMETAFLQCSYDSGMNWKSIADNINLLKGYHSWNAPDSFTTALFRMNINNNLYYSDTISISEMLLPKVGFHCNDSVLLYWPQPDNIDKFIVYRLGEKYMEEIARLQDSFYLFSVADHSSLHYAIAPLHGENLTGHRSFGFNYTTQGSGCYINSFLTDLLSADVSAIRLILGNLYNVTNITLEKFSNSDFISFRSINSPVLMDYIWHDSSLTKGMNTYRVKILLSNGKIIYSSPETIYSFKNSTFLVFPNPLQRRQLLTIASDDPEDLECIIFNAQGIPILNKKLVEQIEKISMQTFSAGIYFYIIRRKGKIEHTGKIVLQ